MRDKKKAGNANLPALILLAALIMFWQMAAMGINASYILPSPTQILVRLWELRGPLFTAHLPATMSVVAIGLLISVVLGLGLAILMDVSEVAEKRLKAIREFTEFGSGFKIAMRDLEIRGAGNILGSQQHGHMAVIGYDLYVKMLNEAIKKVKGEDIEEEIDVEINLAVNAYIPNSYIPEELDKIEMYKKIASIENKDDMKEVTEELIDRFSDVPRSVQTLLSIAYIKSMCKKLKIEKVTQNKNEISLVPLTRYKTKEKIGYKIVNELVDLLEKMCDLNKK